MIEWLFDVSDCLYVWGSVPRLKICLLYHTGEPGHSMAVNARALYCGATVTNCGQLLVQLKWSQTVYKAAGNADCFKMFSQMISNPK